MCHGSTYNFGWWFCVPTNYLVMANKSYVEMGLTIIVNIIQAGPSKKKTLWFWITKVIQENHKLKPGIDDLSLQKTWTY